jgi:hypothetical protein
VVASGVRRAVERGIVEDEHLRLESEGQPVAGHGTQAAKEQIALLGVHDAEGDLDAHSGILAQDAGRDA